MTEFFKARATVSPARVKPSPSRPPATKQHDGQIILVRQNLSSPAAKNFPLFLSGKSVAFSGHPVPNEGRIMIVIYAGWDAVDVARRRVLLRADERR